MSASQTPASALQGTLTSAKSIKEGLEVVVVLRNTADRALHYIADVRAIKFDPATRRLTVRLSDEGRVLVPGAVGLLPRFRYVDPGDQAELRLVLPETIVKLKETGSVSNEIQFEKHRIADAAEITVQVAWADVPFYKDPRSSGKQLPTEGWRQHVLSTSMKMRGKQSR